MSAIKMVSNSEKNHLDELRALFQSDASRLIIASPFLAQNIRELLSEFTFTDVEIIEFGNFGDALHIYSLQCLIIMLYGRYATKIPNRCSRSAPSHNCSRNRASEALC